MSPRPASSLLTCAAGLLCAGALLCHPAPAAAQEVMTFTSSARIGGPMGGGFRPEISRRELDQYWKLLNLDELQTELADSMYEEYRNAHQRVADEAQAKMADLRAEFEETEDVKVFIEDMPRIMRTYGEKSEELTTGFFSEVKLLLTETQVEQWPAVERARRRLKMLPLGHLAGETVDLFTLAEELKLSTESHARVTPVLAQYELELDRALLERETRLAEQDDQGGGIRVFTEVDMEKMREEMAEAHELSLRIRDLNRRWFRMFAAELVSPDTERAEERFRHLSYPQVYRDGYSMRVLDAVGDFEDLTPAQRDQIASIRDRYERDLEIANRRWAEAIDEKESESQAGGMIHPGGAIFFGDGGETGPLGEARSDRRQLDRKTLDSLKAILTEEQVGRLPSRREGEDEGGPAMIQVMDIEIVDDGG